MLDFGIAHVDGEVPIAHGRWQYIDKLVYKFQNEEANYA